VDLASVVPYNLRHTFISEALDRGCPIRDVAVVVGTSVKMIEDFYAVADGDNLHARFLALSEGMGR
jgi:hypothetical protein